jgi:hypothetical protein
VVLCLVLLVHFVSMQVASTLPPGPHVAGTPHRPLFKDKQQGHTPVTSRSVAASVRPALISQVSVCE